jgi:hypothetical protein
MIFIPAHVNGYEVKQTLMVLFLPLLMHIWIIDLLSIVLVLLLHKQEVMF